MNMNNPLSEKEKRVFVSLYKKDNLSYSMALLSILAELVYVISILDVMAVSFLMGVTVMMNIGLLFILFTCAVKMNVYDRRWAIFSVASGIYMLVRQLVFVPVILKPYDRLALIAGANLVGAILLIMAGIGSCGKSIRRQKLQQSLDGEEAIEE